MSGLQVAIVWSFGHLKLQYMTIASLQQIMLSFLLYLFVACREELVFRSYPLRSLAYTFSSAVALAIIVAIFIAEHIIAGMSWQMAVVGSGLGGVLFGVAALKTKGLALPLGLHSAWNFGQWIMGFKNEDGLWRAIVDKGYEKDTENIGLAAFVVVIVLAIIGVVLFYRKKNADEIPHTHSLQ